MSGNLVVLVKVTNAHTFQPAVLTTAVYPGQDDNVYWIIQRSTVILIRTEKSCKCRSVGDRDIPGSITWNVRRRKYIFVTVYVNKVSWKLHKKLIRAWGCSSVVKHLPSLGLIPNVKNNKK